jgi:hypothetical protein
VLTLLQLAIQSSELTADKFLGPTATIIAALFGGTAGAWMGAQIALSRFKRERAFERRLDWYERMIRFLLDMAGKVSIAVTIEGGITRGEDSEGSRPHIWIPVQLAHVELKKMSLEGEMYATSAAVIELRATVKAVQEVANQTKAFHENFVHQQLDLVDPLIYRLREAASVLARQGRTHLGLE